jgi:putative MATE family efflux protein
MLYTKDKLFFKRLTLIAIPILLQNLLSASLNFIDVFMIGNLGEASVAAVGSANQFFFVYSMLIFGLASGTAIFTAQYWGKKDIRGIRSIMGIGLGLTISIALLFTVATLLFPQKSISIFSSDPEVIKLGGGYMQIIACVFLFTALSSIYSAVLRSTENVIYPMVASLSGVILNTVLNYIFIFGKLGFPRMGVIGAAIATLIARIVEASIILIITYIRKLPAAIRVQDMNAIFGKQIKPYLKRTLPVVLQSVGWSAGFSMYTVIYGHLNTDYLAAFNIAGSIERLCHIFFTSLGSACAIMVGNRIGADEEEHAHGYARNFLMIGFLLSIILSTFLTFLRTPIVSYYTGLTATSRTYIINILLVMACIMWAKSFNIVFHMGIFKAGGDTLFSMAVDVGGVWLIGVPIALVAGFVFHLPVHLIVACVTAEEIIKMIIGFIRYRSGRWINNLVAPERPMG